MHLVFYDKTMLVFIIDCDEFYVTLIRSTLKTSVGHAF